jgi:REP element-mobilizing transposase RayT
LPSVTAENIAIAESVADASGSDRKSKHMNVPLAYFITFTTYGTWLHGRAPGSVDRGHNEPGTPFVPADSEKENVERRHLRQPEYRLDAERRGIVLRTIVEVAKHRGWTLWAVHVRSNHVHIVVSAAARPENVMADFKAWASRRLREAFGEDADRDRWTQHGSTIYVWTSETLAEKIAYVVDGQGAAMAVYDSRKTEPEA